MAVRVPVLFAEIDAGRPLTAVGEKERALAPHYRSVEKVERFEVLARNSLHSIYGIQAGVKQRASSTAGAD